MANRRDYYFRQKVTEAELDSGFNDLEVAERLLVSDFGMVGIAIGLVVAQQASPNMTVQVTGPGVAYDQTGQRCAIPSTQNLNVAVDEDALSTAVVTPGNSRILSVFIEFDRTLSDPRVDGNSATVYFVRTESYQFNVAKGVEAGSPTAPALRSDQILLADITLVFGQTTVVTANISTTRRQWAYVTTGTTTNVGTAEEALQALATAIGGGATGLAAHLADAVDAHLATAIGYGGGAVWADSTTNPAATVEAQFDKIITDLTSTSGERGAGKLTLKALGNWADATTNPATTLSLGVAKIITDLAAAGGLSKLGPLTGTTEILYSAVRSKTIVLSLSSYSPAKSTEVMTLFVDSSMLLRFDTTATLEFVGIPLNAVLRTGQIITAARAVVSAGAARASGSRIEFRIQYVAHDFTTPASNPVAATVVSQDEDSGSAGKQNISLSGLAHTVNLATRDYYIVIRAGALTGFEVDDIYGVRIVVDDLGPRNF